MATPPKHKRITTIIAHNNVIFKDHDKKLYKMIMTYSPQHK